MRADDFAIDNCLKCSLCNTVCPVLSVHPQYPGPKHLGPELERLRREGIHTDSEWVEYCLGCHRCDVVCPNQVSVSEMVARAKADHVKTPVHRLRDWWFARPGLLGELSTVAPPLTNFALSMKPARFLMSKLVEITPMRKFPTYRKSDLRKAATNGRERPHVVFFPGCFIRYNRPDLAEKVISLLDRNGFSAEVASTECCGVPAAANGARELAHALARSNVKTLAAQVEAGSRIVTTCSSCGYMLKSAFGGVLEEDKEFAEAARKVAVNTYDLAELLMAQSGEGKLNTQFQQAGVHLAYHAPCHQKSQGTGRPWVHLLGQVPGVKIDDLDAGCCGMSGTYGFKEEKYKVSMAIGQELFERIHEADPQVVVTECATCQMQIEHGAAVKTLHPVEVLFEAYGGRDSK